MLRHLHKVKRILTLFIIIPLISSTDISAFLQSLPSHTIALIFSSPGFKLWIQGRWLWGRQGIHSIRDKSLLSLTKSALDWHKYCYIEFYSTICQPHSSKSSTSSPRNSCEYRDLSFPILHFLIVFSYCGWGLIGFWFCSNKSKKTEVWKQRSIYKPHLILPCV